MWSKDKKNLLLLIFIVVAIFGIIAIFSWIGASKTSDRLIKPQMDETGYKKGEIILNSASVDVEIAETRSQLSKGLGGRAGLGENEGMFFVFDQPSVWGIWMKGMNFPIDIIWFDSEMKVIHTITNAMPDPSLPVFKPQHDSLYVLEVPSGSVEKWGVKEGDKAFLR